MTYLEYEMAHVTKERFDLVFGRVNGNFMWRRYRSAGSIDAFVRQDAEAKQRIDLDIKTLTKRAN